MLYFFFNDTATTEIYTLSLHDALPICFLPWRRSLPPDGGYVTGASIMCFPRACASASIRTQRCSRRDRKSTRLNSSHSHISYAVFCLQHKNITHGEVTVRNAVLNF